MLLLLGGIIAAIAALWFGARKTVAPVYGGPPAPNPQPSPPAPVYGGPPRPNPSRCLNRCSRTPRPPCMAAHRHPNPSRSLNRRSRTPRPPCMAAHRRNRACW